MPMSPSVVVHAMNCTPRSLAMSISSGTPGMRLRRITSFIIRVPKPQKWKRDKGNVSAPPLLKNPNARRSQSTALLDTPGFRMEFSPQKVKNIVTCIPIDAAPVAMMNADMTRSMLPLKTTIVTRSGLRACNSAKAT